MDLGPDRTEGRASATGEQHMHRAARARPLLGQRHHPVIAEAQAAWVAGDEADGPAASRARMRWKHDRAS